MVVEALELGQHHPSPGGPLGDRRPGQGFGCLGKGHGMGDGADAAGALDHGQCGSEGAPLDELLQAPVREEEVGVEMEDPLADRGEAEMARVR